MNVFGGTTMQSIKYAIEFLKKHNKIIGIAGGHDESSLKTWSGFEPDMFFAGADWSFVYTMGKETLKKLNEYL